MKSGKIGTNITITNMKYIEELNLGDCFSYNNQYFVLTTDFKKNGDRLVVSLNDGSSKWLKSNDLIENVDIFTLDKENNILAIKERQKDAAIKNSNIS